MAEVIAVTGASGYVGGLLVEGLRARGHEVLTLGRRETDSIRFELNGAHPGAGWFAFHGIGALVHAAWDFTDRRALFATRRNVLGAVPLLAAAHTAGARVIHISSMSAWDGAPSIYGRAKYTLEHRVQQLPGVSLRLGLVWDAEAGGMAGALRRLSRLPVIVAPTVPAPLYLATPQAVVRAVVTALTAAPGLYTVADLAPVTLPDLLAQLAPGKPVLRVSWRLPWLALRTAEAVGLNLRSHSDSLLSLTRPNPSLDLTHAAQTAA